MTIVFQKSMLKSKAAKRIVADAKLTYFKEKVLEHLDSLERKEKKRERAVQKALIEAECLRKAAYPVGTIREWKGKKYIKTAPGKWRRKYDSDSRGAKQSIAAIKRKVDKCGSVEELLEVAKQNKHRFTDENGRYLPFVKEMFDYVGKKHKEIKGANAGGSVSSGKDKAKAGGSGGGDDGDGGDKTAKIFGHNYKEFKGKGKAAIEKLLETKNGYVEAAYHKEGIGDIDVVYGKILNAEHHKGFGLAHILDKHPDITPETIDKIIRNGKVETRKQKEKGFNIRLGNHVVGINKGYQRRGKVYTTDNWIVTSYEEKYPTGNSHQADVGSFTGGTVSPPNPSDNSNVSQSNGAVKQKTQKNASKRDTAETPDELAKQFGLRGVEIGSKVSQKVAQWHVKKCSESFADIADITGIPDKLVSLNGRLSLAIGARDTRGTYAHYSTGRQAININKTKGSGSLAHEWFHAFDNLLASAMGEEDVDTNWFMTNDYISLIGLPRKESKALAKYINAENEATRAAALEECKALHISNPEKKSEEYQIRVMAAFDNLISAITKSDTALPATIEYNEKDVEDARKLIYKNAPLIAGEIYSAGNFEEATKVILDRFDRDFDRERWLTTAAAYYLEEPKGGETRKLSVQGVRQKSAFLATAEDLEYGGRYGGRYWATTHEMGARAFATYIKDKLAEQGKSNDYLTRDDNDERKFPQGEERKRINAAFDKLFRVIAETKAIRKALNAVAKRKRWLWVDSNGKIWVKKSVMDAWKRAMAE